jgi:hypothetical protein
MSVSVNHYSPKYFLIESLNGETTIDLTNSIINVDYFEDILSPCITVVANLMNSNSLLNSLPIRGGERVAIGFKTLFGDFDLDEEKSLYVVKVSGISPDSVSEFITLHMVSAEALTNETNRCEKRYTGNIKSTVEDILKDTLKTEKYKSSNIEQTSNSYSFIGNFKKPFHILTWLGPKAMPAGVGGASGSDAKGVGGFLFYENIEGFNFRSIENLVSSATLGSGDSKTIQKYTYTQAIEDAKVSNEFKILNYSFEKNIDLMKALRVGMYANRTYFLDFYNHTLQQYDYKLKNEINNKLGGDSSIPVSDTFSESISRIMLRVSDSGVSANDDVKEESGRDVADMAKSYSRYNILFSQALNMVVPCNIKLKVGDVVFAEFPRINRSQNKESDEQQSGHYLIKELRHHFEGGNCITSLRLLRDSYGIS